MSAATPSVCSELRFEINVARERGLIPGSGSPVSVLDTPPARAPPRMANGSNGMILRQPRCQGIPQYYHIPPGRSGPARGVPTQNNTHRQQGFRPHGYHPQSGGAGYYLGPAVQNNGNFPVSDSRPLYYQSPNIQQQRQPLQNQTMVPMEINNPVGRPQQQLVRPGIQNVGLGGSTGRGVYPGNQRRPPNSFPNFGSNIPQQQCNRQPRHMQGRGHQGRGPVGRKGPAIQGISSAGRAPRILQQLQWVGHNNKGGNSKVACL